MPEVSWYSEYSFVDENLPFLHGVHLCESDDLFKSAFLEYLGKYAISWGIKYAKKWKLSNA